MTAHPPGARGPRAIARRALWGALALLALTSPGCYLLHVTGAQLGILCGREDIEDVLEREADPERAAKLRLVLSVRRFAFDTLGLTESGSYTQLYDTGGEPIAYNVSASAPDALAPYGWWFPLMGTLPYIGYFDVELAKDEARRLDDQGLDVVVLPVPAYSTLGWFDDPIFSGMLERSEAEIAETVIHELAHATVWIDQDALFNENLAQFVGEKGAEAFFLARGGPDDPALAEAKQVNQDSERFNAAMNLLRADLERIYAASGERARKLTLKQEAFARFRARYAEEVRPHLHDDRYDPFLEIELNNAWVLAFARYHGERDLFEALFERCGRDVPELMRALKALEDAEDPRLALAARVDGPR